MKVEIEEYEDHLKEFPLVWRHSHDNKSWDFNRKLFFVYTKEFIQISLMDVSEQTASAVNLVKDDVGERCQKLFQDFLEE